MLPCPMLSLFTLNLEERSSQSPSPKPGFSSFNVLNAIAFRPLLARCHPACFACPGGPREPRRERSEGFAFLSCVSHSHFFHHPPRTNRFRIRTYVKCASNPFRIRTSKTQDLKPFRIRTYRKTLGGRACPYSFTPSCEGPLAHFPDVSGKKREAPSRVSILVNCPIS